MGEASHVPTARGPAWREHLILVVVLGLMTPALLIDSDYARGAVVSAVAMVLVLRWDHTALVEAGMPPRGYVQWARHRSGPGPRRLPWLVLSAGAVICVWLIPMLTAVLLLGLAGIGHMTTWPFVFLAVVLSGAWATRRS